MMKLIWKLLRQHISIPQFVGFFLANVFGLFIVLLGYQFYNDVLPVFTSGDSFMKSGHIVVSKRIGAASALTGRTGEFGDSEADELASQDFVKRLGKFSSSSYRVDATMGVAGTNVLNSELFFESVPDYFIDVPLDKWHYKAGDGVVPIILPRSYLAMYNFGFAQSRSLPKISEGLVGMIDFDLYISGAGRRDHFKGQVIGFSSRLNSILVPQSFMDWSNKRYAPDDDQMVTRLIIDVANPTDNAISSYMEQHGYDVADSNMDAEKTTYFLRLLVTMVVAVGLVIAALSFYILMLSIYLLVQKNSTKLENLLLIGYAPSRVAMPYQLLTLSLNILALAIVWVAVYAVRTYYMGVVEALFPNVDNGTLCHSLLLGLALFVLVSLANIAAIRHKINSIGRA